MWDGPHGTDSGPDVAGELAGLLGACARSPPALALAAVLFVGCFVGEGRCINASFLISESKNVGKGHCMFIRDWD